MTHHTTYQLMGFKTIKATCGARVSVANISAKPTCQHCRDALALTIGQNAHLLANHGLSQSMVAILNAQTAQFVEALS